MSLRWCFQCCLLRESEYWNRNIKHAVSCHSFIVKYYESLYMSNVLASVLTSSPNSYIIQGTAAPQPPQHPSSLPFLIPHPLIQTLVCPSRPFLGQHEQWHSRLWGSATHLRMDLYLQHRTRKQLVNPFSLRPLICSYLLQQPKKSQGIFSSLLAIDPALRKSALLSKHYWSLPLNDRISHQCIKGLDELKFHFRQLVPVIFTLFSIVGNMRWRAATHRESISSWRRVENRDGGETI